MFGLGLGELLVVLVIALIFLGPDKIPKTAHTLGKWVYDLKHSLDDVKDAFEKDIKPSSKKPSPESSLEAKTSSDSKSSNG